MRVWIACAAYIQQKKLSLWLREAKVFSFAFKIPPCKVGWGKDKIVFLKIWTVAKWTNHFEKLSVQKTVVCGYLIN